MDDLDMSDSLFLVVDVHAPEISTSDPEPFAYVKLVEALCRGDRSVFEQVYNLFAPMVHGILLARVPRNEVDDLVQDVFVQVLEKLHTLRDNRAFGGWLATIARNRANDFHRSSQNTEELTEGFAHHDQTEVETEAARVLLAIKRLPDAYKETLILRLVEGMNGPEIAALTGLTPASVRVNLHRGMKLLRAQLGLEDHV